MCPMIPVETLDVELLLLGSIFNPLRLYGHMYKVLG